MRRTQPLAGRFVGGATGIPDARLPESVRGWRVVDVVEVLTDAGTHQAFAIVLEEPGGWSHPATIALWWNRYVAPARFELTPISAAAATPGDLG